MVDSVRPDILHLCGPPGALEPADVRSLRDEIGATSIMQAVAVTGPDALDVARSFAPVVDYLLLDSVAPDIPGIGAAGTVHDWDISAEIVASVDVPVILAGGLAEDNVRLAIQTVRPWGVDVSSGVESLPGTKDHELIKRFISAVRAAEEEI